MEKVTRRAFIGGVGAILATGAMAMSGCAPKDDAKQAELSATGSDQPEATVPDETLEFDIAVVGAAVPALPLVSRQPNRAHRLSVSRRRALPAAQRAASRVCSP